MLRGIWGDPDRYRETYWSRFPGRYFAGDGAKRDDDGYFWLLGRVDDVMLVSGHNISTAEVESALVSHPAVAEAAVIGRTDATTGQAISAFVILRAGNEPSDALGAELREHVVEVDRADRQAEDGPVHRGPPQDPFSGKIMRRLLRNVAEDQQLGDTTTLADPSVVEGIKARVPVGAGRRRGGVSASSVPPRFPEHWHWRKGPIDTGPRRGRRPRRRAERRGEPPALHRGAAP